MMFRLAVPGAVLVAAVAATTTFAQTPTPGQSPHSAPSSPTPSLEEMTPLPGLGVEWPQAMAPVADGATASTDSVGETKSGRYALTVTGLDKLDLVARFRELSALYKGRNADANVAQINRRAVEDSDLVDQLLRSIGRYGGTTKVVIIPPPKAGDPTAVLLAVEPGPVYTFSAVNIRTPPGTPPRLIEPLVGAKAGDPVSAVPLATAQDAMRLALAAKGYPFPTISPLDIVVDHSTRTAVLTQEIDPGRRGRFGVIRANNKSLMNGGQLQRLARFKTGDVYNDADVDDLRRAMIATGLFGAVAIKPVAAGATPDGDTAVDLQIATEAAPLRTVAATAGYSTSQGIRVEASWQHRNLIKPGGAVTFNVVAAEREQTVGAQLRRQNWRARDVTLTLRSEFSAKELDAFNARTLTFGASIERETNLIWQKKWYYSLGVEAVATREVDRSAFGEPARLYYIAAAPLSLSYDGSDNLLDPTRGFRLTGRASPELSVQSNVFGYLKAQLEGSTYLPVGARVVLAARAHFGSIIGASRGSIAPTRRFYAGGGGSLRGFGYQKVGPEDADGSPTGGNSITEGSFEARVRFGNFGVVPFIDVGQVFNSTIPSFDSLKIGAGLGARYYTSFGPVRIDIATPVNGRRNDAKVQFYVSIGQAF